jgi:hypothetical protein
MDFQLMNGGFTKSEAIEMVSQMVAVKINFHRSKIAITDNEEDIKMREMRIKGLQERLDLFRSQLREMGDFIHLEGKITVK